ncbi:MAG: carboxypeptidase-like regulatory domain-containing protein, partial [Planctomycetota bacterium JB042]
VVNAGRRERDVVLTDGVVVDLGDLTLPPGGRLEGDVVDAQGLPIERAAVFFRSARGLTSAISDTLTRPDGTFERDGLAAGRWTVSARALGYGLSSTEVDVAPGATATVRIALGETASLRVRVVDATGAPVPGASVEVRDAAGRVVSDLLGPADAESGFLVGGARPGVVVVTGLSPGPHVVTASKDGAGDGEESVLVDANPTAVTVVLD